ncbi:MAG TPA: glycosyltransferase family 4 protein [Rhizomicrobium sp.]|jgi:glycosyltransferase involved in cell wall biosynthesis
MSAAAGTATLPQPTGLVPTKTAPLRFTFPVAPASSYMLDIEAVAESEPSPLAALIAFTFTDSGGKEVKAPEHGLLTSRNFAAYLYLPLTVVGQAERKRLRVPTPRQAAQVEVTIRPWRSSGVRLLRQPALLETADTRSAALVAVPASAPGQGPQNRVVDYLRRQLPQMRGGKRIMNWLGFTPLAKVRPPLWTHAFECVGEQTYQLEATIGFSGPFVAKEALIAVEFWDAAGEPINRAAPGLTRSDTYGWYRYFERRAGDDGPQPVSLFLRAPAQAVRGRARFFPLSRTLSLVAETPPSLAVADWKTFREGLQAPQLDLPALRSLLDVSVSEGDLDSTIEIVSLLQLRETGRDYQRRLNILRGTRQELRTDWLPRIFGTTRPGGANPERWHPAHILKSIVPQEASGGAVRSWNIVKHQAQMGWSPTALLPASSSVPEADFDAEAALKDGLRTVDKDGVRIVYPKFQGLERVLYRPDQMLELETSLYAQHLATGGCNLVHAASGFKGFDNALKGIVLSDWLSLPLVYEIRSFHEHTWSPPRKDVERAPLAQLRSQQELRCIRAADAIVTISDAMVEELVNRGADPESVFMVPNSVDETFFEPVDPAAVAALRAEMGLTGAKVVGYISNMSHREGHDLLVTAMRELPDLHCVLVGNGQRRPYLEKLAQELGVATRVHFTGEVPHERIRDYYALIDIFVVPRLSDYASDFVTPLKPFEALALGRSLVMSDRPVAREILGADQRGLSFVTGEVGDLVRAVRALADNPEKARALTEAGRKWVRQERSWDRTVRIYEKVYDHAAGIYRSRAMPHARR